MFRELEPGEWLIDIGPHTPGEVAKFVSYVPENPFYNHKDYVIKEVFFKERLLRLTTRREWVTPVNDIPEETE